MHECPECGMVCYCDLDDSNDCRDRGVCYHEYEDSCTPDDGEDYDSCDVLDGADGKEGT